MPKFEAKKEILQKFDKNWGAIAPHAPGSAAHEIKKINLFNLLKIFKFRNFKKKKLISSLIFKT